MNSSVQLDIDDVAPHEKVTTGGLMDLLSKRYPRDRYALFFDVPDNVGTNQHRRADAIAIGCWGSVGRLIEGFELKASRADWLREVSHVTKADPFIERCDKWWLVTSSPTIARLEEIPACWGWMAATKGGLRVQKPAVQLPQDAKTIHRLFAIGLLRKMQDSLLDEPTVLQRLKEAREVREVEIAEKVRQGITRANREAIEIKDKVQKFERESGIKLDDWRMGNVGKLVRAFANLHRDGDAYGRIDTTLERAQQTFETMIQRIREARQELAEPEGKS
jgi:hypothetical protein